MIELHTYPTANGQRASIMLEACSLPYRAHRVDLRAGAQRSEAFRHLNPAGAIPVLVDPDGPGGGELVLAQSAAIMLYLAQKTGRFLPAEPRARILAMRWFFAVMTDIAAASATITLTGRSSDPPPAEAIAFWERRLLTLLEPYEAQLAGAAYLNGALSIADLALYPTYVARRSLIENGGGRPNLRRWAAAIDGMPEVQRGMAAGS